MSHCEKPLEPEIFRLRIQNWKDPGKLLAHLVTAHSSLKERPTFSLLLVSTLI